jgi:hypothetical protein
MRADWQDSGGWRGDGLEREVFFFRSRGVDLYGSLYRAAEISRPFGIVACNSWGVEADRCDPLQRSVALAMAKLGGAGFVFHYPGYGDSYGELADLTVTDLSEAASDAVAEASRRCPGLSWILVGFMFGASVACVAQREAGIEQLLLVQPALAPSAYFKRLFEGRRPLSPGSKRPKEMLELGTVPGMAYGYPVPRQMAAGTEADAPVAAALAAFGGDGAVIRHAKPPETDPVPERFERVVVPGTWRFGAQNNPKLASATTDWLDRRTGEISVR